MPATLATGFCLALLIFMPQVSSWARPWFYGQFLEGKGALPSSSSVVIVAADNESGPLDRALAANLAKAILELHPVSLAVDLPQNAFQSWENAMAPLPSGPVVVASAFREFHAWELSDAAKQYPSMVSRSLYPLLDGPEGRSGSGLKLSMGDGLETPDSMDRWPAPTTGFSGPLPEGPVYSLPAFARLGRGVVASLGVEAARRAMNVSADKVGYVEGVGALFNAGHVLPLDGHGEMLLRFLAPGGLPTIPASKVLNGKITREEIQGKIVFVGAGPAGATVKTAAGNRPVTEVWATAASNIYENTTITAPSWGGLLSIGVGLALGGIILLIMSVDLGGAVTFGLAVLLAAVYPILSYWLFVKGSQWLSPELPPMMVFAAYLPFALTRLAGSRSDRLNFQPAFNPAPSPAPIAPIPKAAWVPQTPPMTPPRGVPVTGLPQGVPRPQADPRALAETMPPPRAKQGERQAPLEKPSIPSNPRQAPPQGQPVMGYADPHEPQIIPRESIPQPAPMQQGMQSAPPLQQQPPMQPGPQQQFTQQQAQPQSVRPAPQPQAPQGKHTGSISDEIERDAKGGLVRVGKYRIVRKMGFGSAGDVFEGFDTHMSRKVAIKTITKNAAAHFDRAAERFVLEAKAAGSLNHPCINTIYDFGSIREVSYMVLEFLDGVTLSQWMRANPNPPRPETVLPWLQQISSALDYAHGHKVIHRDLKPSNLMVVNNGATIKLLDFGIAKMEDVGLTQTGMTVGTPSYMSPEQLSGIKVGPASDQYGLAVVLYQLFTYKLPYVGTKIPELCNRILKNDLIPISDFNPSLGGPFWEAMKKSLAKTPEERYPSCQALVQALESTFPV